MITALDMTSSCDVIMWLTLSDICNFHVQSTSQNFSLFSFLKSQFIFFAQKGLQIEAFWLVDYWFDSWLDHKFSFWKPTSGNLVSGFFDDSTWCWCVANSNRGTNWESISLHIPVLTSDSNIESPVWSSKIEINTWAVFFSSNWRWYCKTYSKQLQYKSLEHWHFRQVPYSFDSKASFQAVWLLKCSRTDFPMLVLGLVLVVCLIKMLLYSRACESCKFKRSWYLCETIAKNIFCGIFGEAEIPTPLVIESELSEP